MAPIAGRLLEAATGVGTVSGMRVSEMRLAVGRE